MKKTLLTTALIGFCLFSATAGAVDRGNPARGAELAAQCAACHGPKGDSATPDFPRIAGQYQDYLVHSLQKYKTGERKNAIMAGIVANLSDADMHDLAAFFAQQQGTLYSVDVAQ